MKGKMKRWLALVTMACLGILASAVAVFAESGGSGTANTAVTTAMQDVANDMLATGNAMIPIALTVVGIGLVVVFGIRIFTKIAKAK